MIPAPGSPAFIRVNHGQRPCTVLAVIKGLALVEYEMPNHTTALAFARPRKLLASLEGRSWLCRVSKRPCSYRQLTKTWLTAVVEQAGRWYGDSHAGKVPSPGVLLRQRFVAPTAPVTPAYPGVS